MAGRFGDPTGGSRKWERVFLIGLPMGYTLERRGKKGEYRLVGPGVGSRNRFKSEASALAEAVRIAAERDTGGPADNPDETDDPTEPTPF